MSALLWPRPLRRPRPFLRFTRADLQAVCDATAQASAATIRAHLAIWLTADQRRAVAHELRQAAIDVERDRR